MAMMTFDVVCEMIEAYNIINNGAKTPEQFMKFMEGQTVSVIYDVPLYYLCDVRRFLSGEPVVD
jgi:hypothetical protein